MRSLVLLACVAGSFWTLGVACANYEAQPRVLALRHELNTCLALDTPSQHAATMLDLLDTCQTIITEQNARLRACQESDRGH